MKCFHGMAIDVSICKEKCNSANECGRVAAVINNPTKFQVFVGAVGMAKKTRRDLLFKKFRSFRSELLHRKFTD